MSSKYIITNRFGVTELVVNADGFYQDPEGTVYAFKNGKSVDPVARCGVKPFTLPLWDCFEEVNEACGIHDNMYEMPVYQAFHTRDEADDYLEHLIELSGHPILADIFSELARELGAPFWENQKTR